eukprot:TRINITY_DN32102_c0_g1_i1.p1 TRINITY_DN32102_c0_g1~~TRINITY_DN32102_c0_g1_i1.p1  ORF type:complete len:453 (-),score=78.55 TRINITY_DN32102_c0_g1_i1:19-1377(-)
MALASADDGSLAAGPGDRQRSAHQHSKSESARCPLQLATPRQPPTRPSSASGKRPYSAERLTPPPLTRANAEAAGLLPSRCRGAPFTSVLTSSKIRQMRVFRSGSRCSSVEPSLRAACAGEGPPGKQTSEDLDVVMPLQSESLPSRSYADKVPVSPRSAANQDATSAAQMPILDNRKKSQGSDISRLAVRKRLCVCSDFSAPTESWSARMPSEKKREKMRQNRKQLVFAGRTTSIETILAECRGKSLMELTWAGNLVDPEIDTEITLSAAMGLLERTGVYHHTDLTLDDLRNFLNRLLSGEESSAIAPLAGRRGTTITGLQFQALMHWIAQHKGISFSECMTKLVTHPGAVITKLEHYFAEFGSGSCPGFMTVYDFTRFCKTFGLFGDRPDRFVEGDVYFMFLYGKEGKAVDLHGFKRLLTVVAEKLEMNMTELLHLLAERELASSKGMQKR